MNEDKPELENGWQKLQIINTRTNERGRLALRFEAENGVTFEIQVIVNTSQKYRDMLRVLGYNNTWISLLTNPSYQVLAKAELLGRVVVARIDIDLGYKIAEFGTIILDTVIEH